MLDAGARSETSASDLRPPPQPPNPFRVAEKSFKAYKDGRPCDAMKRLVDFAVPDDDGVFSRVPVSDLAPPWLHAAQIYSLQGVDGFRFIRCPFDHDAQLRLASTALREWIEPPSATNLELHGVGPLTNLWEGHERDPHGSSLSRLTWATVGYQYQWTERQYDPSKHSPFPAELEQLGSDLAAACGWVLHPEAAIINLYGVWSTMGGHVDDAEPCQTAPIVSISLGLDAVYLLGRETKESEPVAIRLRSGDVVLQGGQSRSFVHGVPRVLAGTLPDELSERRYADRAAGRLATVARWLSDHRLNINVRQCWDRDAGTHELGLRRSDASERSSASHAGGAVIENGDNLNHKKRRL